MALKDRTKKMFAETLETMLRTTTFEKVRVKDLCEKCGADRQTFYYHFRDKYDLAAWIFAQDYITSLEYSGGQFVEEHAAEMLRRMYKRRHFYRKVYYGHTQNAVSEYCFRYFVDLGRAAYRAETGQKDIDVLTDYAIKSHSYACVGHTIQWLNGYSSYTPEEFAHLQYQTMPDVLKKAYKIPIGSE